MKKILLTITLSLVCSSVSAKTLLCTEQFIGVITLADRSEFAAPITREEPDYKNTVIDNGDSFTVVLLNGSRLYSGKLNTFKDGSQGSERNGLTYKKYQGKFFISDERTHPRYREWSVYKDCN